MVIPPIPRSSPVIQEEIAYLRELNRYQYLIAEFSSKRFNMMLASSAVCFVLGLFIDLSIIGGLLVFFGLALGAIVLVGAKFLHPYLRRMEFQVVVKINQKFMKMFGLIAEGILTKEEFKQKATDLVGIDQVDRFFARRIIETKIHNGEITNDQYHSELSLIGYGPEQADDSFEFESWRDDLG